MAVMQPYFLPYIGYWQLILGSDHFCFFDTVKFSKKSWITRNRILNPDVEENFSYITIPVKKGESKNIIKEVQVSENFEWKRDILEKAKIYRKVGAPNFKEGFELLEKILYGYEGSFLIGYLLHSFDSVFDYLGKKPNYSILSQTNFDNYKVDYPGGWAPVISEYFGAKEYLNPIGGKNIFQKKDFENKGIKLKFLCPILEQYGQKINDFVPGLSIIDFVMFLKKEEILNHAEKKFSIKEGEEVEDG